MKRFLLIMTTIFFATSSLIAQLDSTNLSTPLQERVAPPPPPPPPKPKVEEVFKRVENTPRFPGCENIGGTNAEKKQCADRKMLEFIYKNVVYPEAAKEAGLEGTCVVQFVVEKDGKLTNIKAVRDIGKGCGAEAERVVNLMNEKGLKWTPGPARGRNVRVQFNVPVKFRLD